MLSLRALHAALGIPARLGVFLVCGVLLSATQACRSGEPEIFFPPEDSGLHPRSDAGPIGNDAGSDAGNDAGNDAAQNHAPVAIDLEIELDEDTSISEQLNVTDADGDALSIELVDAPEHGELALDTDSEEVTYTPEPDFFGEDSFTFRASDGSEESTLATVRISVLPVNDAPVATGASLETDEDTEIDFELEASDVEGDALEYEIVDEPEHGVLSGAGPELTYTPDANFNGEESFAFRANDGTLDSEVVTVTIAVAASNDAPDAVLDSATVAEGGTTTLISGGGTNLLLNDSDVEADALALSTTAATAPTHGTLTLNADGSFSYTHDGGESTTDSFIYTVCDDGTPSECSTASVNIAVTPVNDMPVAVADAIAVDEAGTIALLVGGANNVLANDTDADGDTLSVSVDSDVTNGTLTLNTNGTFSYTHDDSETTADSFVYEVCDNDAVPLCATATVTITIAPVNEAPIATNDTLTLAEGGTATLLTGSVTSVLGNDSDPDVNTTLSVTLETSVANGSLTLNANGTFSYTHNDGETTSDSFVYEVCDGAAVELCDTAAVTITVTPVNDAPVAINDAYTLDEDTAFDSSPLGVDDNDTDSDSATRTVTTVPVTDVAHGTLTLGANGTFDYTHDGSETTSDSFVYEICDNATVPLCDTATVTLTINPVNDSPVATDDDIAVNEGGTVALLVGGTDNSVTDNDSDIETAQADLTVTVETDVVNGTLALNTDGTFSYTHNGTETTTDSFVYEVCDDDAIDQLCDTATVDIAIGPVNEAPVAGLEMITVTEGGVVTVLDSGAATVLANDTDTDLDSLTVTGLAPGGDVGHGVLVLNADGTFSYTHDSGDSTLDGFTYRVCDVTGSPLCVDSSVVITIEPVNDAPVAVADSIFVTEGGTGTVVVGGNDSLLDNDLDSEGGVLEVTLVTGEGVDHGVLTLQTDGTFSYTHDGNQDTSDSFTYSICDDGTPQECDEAVVSITITGENDAPVATADAFTVNEGASVALVGNVLDNDTDADADVLAATVVPVDGVDHGLLVLNTNGTFSYAHDGSETATDSFIYEVCDDEPLPSRLCHTATVTITITAVNDAPSATVDVFGVSEGALLDSAPVSLLDNDTDAEGDTLSVTTMAVMETQHGMLILSADGTFTYDHSSDEASTDTFTYEVCDDRTPRECSTTSVTINITGINDLPVAANDNVALNEGGTATTLVGGGTSVLDNDTDAEDDTLAVAVVTQPLHGELTLNPTDGTFEYVHDGSETASDSFVYEVCDGSPDECPTATVTIAIAVQNDPPVATNDSITVDEDEVASALTNLDDSVLDNDTDDEGDILSVAVVTQPLHGTVTLNPDDGTFEYEHDGSETTHDSFVYEVCDGARPVCPTATVDIEVTPVNDLPEASDEDVSLNEGGTAITLVGGDTSVLDNDSDAEDDILTVAVVTDPLHGELTLDPDDGTFEYVHDGSNNTSDSFVYEVCDGSHAHPECPTATVTIAITLLNDAPIAIDDDIEVYEGAIASVLASLSGSVLDNDTDDEDDTLTVAVVTDVFHGTLTLDPDGTFEYEHDGSETTHDAFVYEVCDGSHAHPDCLTATVDIEITPVNDPPEAADDDVALNEGGTATTLVGGDSNVLDNDTDAENDSLAVAVVTDPLHGTLTLGTFGTFEYVHDGSENASDSFVYEVCDDSHAHPECPTATVTIAITLEDAVPVATNDDIAVNEGATASVLIGLNGSVLDNDSDDEGDTLTAAVVSGAYQGTLTLDPDGTFEYVHDGSETTQDSFVYEVCDSTHTHPACPTATVYIEITPVNDAPVAGTYSYTNVVGNTLYSVSGSFPTDDALLLGTEETDVEGDAMSIISFSASSVRGGTVTLNTSTGEFAYLPPAGNLLADSFTYTVQDDGTPAASTVVTVNLGYSGARVWYVDAAHVGTQNGRSSQPFTSLAGAMTASSANDTIYVAAGNYGTATTLLAGQSLIGAGDDFSPSATVNFLAGTRPTLGAVTLASNNTIRGVNISTTAALTNAVTGSNVGVMSIGNARLSATNGSAIQIAGGTSVTLSDLGTITARNGLVISNVGTVAGGEGISVAAVGGPALDITHTSSGTAQLEFDSLSSLTSSTFGIRLENINGSFVSWGTTVTNPVSFGISVSGATAVFPGNPSANPNFNFGPTDVTHSGATSPATVGDAYAFSNNPNATITLWMIADPNTDNGRALFASNSGTLRLNEVYPTITAHFGAALDLRDTIGSGSYGWHFVCIRSYNSTAEGMRLENLTEQVRIDGTCSSANELNNSASHGIYGSNIASLYMRYLAVYRAGNGFDEHGISLEDINGTFEAIDSSVYDSAHDGLKIVNSAGTSASVELNNFQFYGNQGFYCDSGTAGCDGSGLSMRSAGDLSLNMYDSDFYQITGEGVEIVATAATSDIHATIFSNTFSNSLNGDSAIELLSEGGLLQYDISSNDIANFGGHIISVGMGADGSTVEGYVYNNTIDANNLFGGQGIRVVADADDVDAVFTGRADISYNTISHTSGDGIFVENRDGGEDAVLHARVQHNNTSSIGGEAIRVRARDTTFVCAEVDDNYASTTGSYTVTASDTSTFRLYSANVTTPDVGAAAAEAYLLDLNSSVLDTTATQALGATLTVTNVGACLSPTF